MMACCCGTLQVRVSCPKPEPWIRSGLTTQLGQFILSVTDYFFCPYGRSIPRHHRRPRTRAGGSAADSIAAPSIARAAAVGAATRENDGDAPPAGAVPPAEARVAAAGGGA